MTTPTSDETPEQATRRMFTEAQDTVADWPQPEPLPARLQIHVGPPGEPRRDHWMKRLFLRGER